MKKIFTFLFLLPLFIFTIAQKGFVIKGAVSGTKEQSVVFLTDANNPSDTVAKSQLSGGKFVLKGLLSEPGLYNINFSDPQKKGLFFLDNSKISVTGKVSDIQNLKVEGSASHSDFKKFQRDFTPLFEKLNSIGQQVNLTGMTDSLNAETSRITEFIQVRVDDFIRTKKSSYVTPFLLVVTAQLSKDAQILQKRYSYLSEDLKKSYYGKYVREMIETLSVGAVGSKAIDFTQNDPDGKPVSLSSFKGKYVLVDFWASWCGPCREENPNVVNTYNTYKSKNFTVLGVSLDRSRDPWLKAIQNDNLTWTHVSDLKFWSNEVAQKYKIQSIPQNFLIDPSGNIIARNLRGSELPHRLSELLK